MRDVTDKFFITLKIKNSESVFIDEKYFKVIIESLKYCVNNKGVYIIAYSLLINHLHLVFQIKQGFQASSFIRDFKRHTAKRIIKLLKEDDKQLILLSFQKKCKLKNNRYKVWKRGCHPVAIFSHEFFEQKVNYTNFNILKHNPKVNIEEYPYTSYHNYYCNHPVLIEIKNSVSILH